MQKETMLMKKLADRIIEIVDNRNNFLADDFQNAIDAVIMAAYQEGENAIVQKIETRHR